jgi:GntR family transcriptional regulator, transcriptional repressor for pyruvate dehydrogenase complex
MITSSHLSPIKRSRSLVEEVSLKLSDFILSELPPDQKTLPSERALAESMGVSRPVVREAVQRLELQGLVEIRQGVGTAVVNNLHKPLIGSLSLLIPDEAERLKQLNETRLAIEPMAAKFAAERAGDLQIQALWDLHEELQAATDVETAIEIDLNFHRAVAEASGNLMYRLILDSLAEIGRESRMLTIGRIGKQTAIDHHRPIIQAIEDKEPEKAAAAMHFHILAARKDMDLE